MAAKEQLGDVVKALFRLKRKWKDIDDDSKDGSFFIINQFCAKNSPGNAQALNRKGLDPAVGAEIWNSYYSDTRSVPDWFWRKPVKLKYENDFEALDEKDQWIISNFYAEDLEQYKKELEFRESTHQTAKVRKNSKISKLNKQYESLF